MAYDDSIAALMRADLAGRDAAEKGMFGGLAFMVAGHMVAGISGEGGFYRVGKARRDEALALPGVAPMRVGGRVMGGYVLLASEAMGDCARRGRLTEMALDFVATLPAK